MKHVASFKQYHAAYAGGHLYVWNVMFGLGVGVGGRGFGVVRLEQASEIEIKNNTLNSSLSSLRNSIQPIISIIYIRSIVLVVWFFVVSLLLLIRTIKCHFE